MVVEAVAQWYVVMNSSQEPSRQMVPTDAVSVEI